MSRPKLCLRSVLPVSVPVSMPPVHTVRALYYLRKYMRTAGLSEEMIAAILFPDFSRTAHCASESEPDNTPLTYLSFASLLFILGVHCIAGADFFVPG